MTARCSSAVQSICSASERSDAWHCIAGRIYGCGHNGRFLGARFDDGEWLWNVCQPSTGERPADWANVFRVQHRDGLFLAND